MSLRSRIVLAVAVVFAVVGGLAGGLMLRQAELGLETAFDRAVRTRAGWLLSLVGVDPIVIPLPADTERMRLSYQSEGRSRELFRSPGWESLDGSSTRPARRPHPRQPGPIHRYVRQNGTYRTVTVQSTPDQTPDGRLTLTLAVPDASLRADVSRLRWLFGLGWLLSLALAFGAGYVVAGWLLRPIQTIVGQADRISNATTADPLRLPQTRDELYALTDALNRMLARLRERVETQQNFFGAAAHELRTPLTVMKTGLDVTLRRLRTATTEPDAPTTEFLAGQLDEVNRLTRLLDEFLTLSRPDDAQQPLNQTPVNVVELLQSCLDQLKTVAADYTVTIRFEPPADATFSLLTDATKLEHILLNLLENAIKYAVAGGVVTVGLSALPAGVLITVRNQTKRESGPTLDLLQPYFRADPLKEGHGLGLWISHRLTTLLGGQLRLDWQAFVFTAELTLPAT